MIMTDGKKKVEKSKEPVCCFNGRTSLLSLFYPGMRERGEKESQEDKTKKRNKTLNRKKKRTAFSSQE